MELFARGLCRGGSSEKRAGVEGERVWFFLGRLYPDRWKGNAILPENSPFRKKNQVRKELALVTEGRDFPSVTVLGKQDSWSRFKTKRGGGGLCWRMLRKKEGEGEKEGKERYSLGGRPSQEEEPGGSTFLASDGFSRLEIAEKGGWSVRGGGSQREKWEGGTMSTQRRAVADVEKGGGSCGRGQSEKGGTQAMLGREKCAERFREEGKAGQPVAKGDKSVLFPGGEEGYRREAVGAGEGEDIRKYSPREKGVQGR